MQTNAETRTCAATEALPCEKTHPTQHIHITLKTCAQQMDQEMMDMMHRSTESHEGTQRKNQPHTSSSSTAIDAKAKKHLVPHLQQVGRHSCAVLPMPINTSRSVKDFHHNTVESTYRLGRGCHHTGASHAIRCSKHTLHSAHPRAIHSDPRIVDH